MALEIPHLSLQTVDSNSISCYFGFLFFPYSVLAFLSAEGRHVMTVVFAFFFVCFSRLLRKDLRLRKKKGDNLYYPIQLEWKMK